MPNVNKILQIESRTYSSLAADTIRKIIKKVMNCRKTTINLKRYGFCGQVQQMVSIASFCDYRSHLILVMPALSSAWFAPLFLGKPMFPIRWLPAAVHDSRHQNVIILNAIKNGVRIRSKINLQNWRSDLG